MRSISSEAHFDLKFCDTNIVAFSSTGASLVAQMVKNLPATQETQVQFPVQEDPLEEEMVIHSNILAWRVPWTEEPSGL